ncbi:MAG: PKD domain-containing protein [Saprospiraceae bacterium]
MRTNFCCYIFLLLLSPTYCFSQDEVQISALPESSPGAKDGQLTLVVQNVGNGPSQNPPPFTFVLTPDGGSAITIENATGVATFSGLGYQYYCLTVVMGNRCSGSTCFYFDASCSTNCLVADFNFAHQYDGCSVEFEDWSESGANSWQWDFGDGSTSSEPNPVHTYSAPGCYVVVLTVSNGNQNRTLTRQVCISGCGDVDPSVPECHISGPTKAGQGQTINLTGTPTGVGPFQHDWTTPAFIDPLPSSQSPAIAVEIPENASNGTEYHFSLVVRDYDNTPGSTCTHTITVSGNTPDVDLSAFGSFQPNMPLVLVAFVDAFNLTGPEQYYFTIKKGGDIVQIPNSCLNTWINSYDCTLPTGLEEGFYTICVDVRDGAGTYSDCIPVTIGSPTPVPPSPAMWLEVKYPASPITDPVTGNYILRAGEFFHIGIDGNHPFNGWFDCQNIGDQFFIVLHIKNLTTGETLDIGDPFNGIPAIMSSWPDMGLNWYYGLVTGCKKGTLRITADVYSISCENPYPPPITNYPEVLYQITQPLFVDLYPKLPRINSYSVDFSSCNQPITAQLEPSCSIVSYSWHAYDPYTNEVIENFFTGNTNTASVTPNVNHTFFSQFQTGDIAKIRCDVMVVDVNGYTASFSSILNLKVPLRLNIPSEITRCPGVESTFSVGPLASGGAFNYTFTWSDPTLSGPNPTFTAPLQGSATYGVTVSDGASCSLSRSITVTASALNLDGLFGWYTCEGGSNKFFAQDEFGGSGQYAFQWSAVDPAHLGYLSATDILNPIVQGFGAGQTITYTITVEDVLGGCSASRNVTVQSLANDLAVTLTGPGNVCARDEAVLTAAGTPVVTGWGAGLMQYHWSTNNRNHNLSGLATNTKVVPITEVVSSYPGTYNYKVRYTNIISGCYAEAEKNVTIRQQWQHIGFVPSVRSAVAGTPMELWDGDNNYFTSGPTGAKTITWTPITPTVIEWSNGVPKKGTFIPTPEVPFLTMTVTETATGCQKSFKTNRYFIIESEPEFYIIKSNSAVCVGGEVCYDIIYDAKLLNYKTTLLPQWIDVFYTFEDVTTTPHTRKTAPKRIKLALQTTSGFYKGQLCESDFFSILPPNLPIGGHGTYNLTVTISQESKAVWGIHWSYEKIAFNNVGIYSSVQAFPNHIERCRPWPSNERGLTMKYGTLPCPEGPKESIGPLTAAARDYIEIIPDAGFETVPFPNQKVGRVYFINPCITPVPNLHDPEPVFTSDRYAPENFDDELGKLSNGSIDLHAHPNPFSQNLNIRYSFYSDESAGNLTISLLDLTGRAIQTLRQEHGTLPGDYAFDFDGGHLAPGIYLLEITVEEANRVTRKVVKVAY